MKYRLSRNFPVKLYVGIAILLAVVSLFLFYLLISKKSPYETALSIKNQPPSFSHFFGTDELGRDLFARVGQGIGISCFIGCIAFTIDMSIGILWGILAATSKSQIITEAFHKIAEVLYSLPYLLVVLLISVISGTGIIPLVIAMLTMGWIQTARITETVVKEALSSEYVLSAHVLGISPKRILLRHVLPNVLTPIVASSLMSIPHAIFAEAFLSFLGVGIQPPKASLGSLISDALPALRFYPWRLIIPASVITLLTLSITCIVDALLEIADPKIQKLYERISISDQR